MLRKSALLGDASGCGVRRVLRGERCEVLCKCVCWFVIEVIPRNAWCNSEDALMYYIIDSQI